MLFFTEFINHKVPRIVIYNFEYVLVLAYLPDI